MPTPIIFIDMRDRDKAERSRLQTLKADLELRKRQNGGGLPDDQETELQRITDLLAINALRDDDARARANQRKDELERKPNRTPDEEKELQKLLVYLASATVLDPLFKETKAQLISLGVIPPRDSAGSPFEHRNGLLPSQRVATTAATAPLTAQETTLVAVFGLLQLDNADPKNTRRFPAAVTNALGEYTAGLHAPSGLNLFDKVLAELVNDGDISQGGELRGDQIGAVFRTLRSESVPPTNPLLPLKVRAALGKIGAGAAGAVSSVVEIDLPDLEEQADLEIQADNLKALQGLYFSAMLEEMQFFRAMDAALEQWQLGMLVLSRGAAGDKFYDYWRNTNDRFSELERRSLYARAFGIPGGDAIQGTPNREFKDLWLRFLSAVSSFSRQIQVDNLLRANIPVGVSQELVRQTGRDLASNLSLHGYGIAYFAATELQGQINEIIALLSHPEVKASYGARDMFQVIEQIISYQGGGIVNSIQKRVSANAGSIIIRWLANRAQQLAGVSFGEILSVQAIRNPLPRVPGDKATTNPTDADLVNAVEQWLAVNGVRDDFIEEQAQAAEPPAMYTRPIQVPSIARDLLEEVGVPMAAGAGHSNGHGHGNGGLATRNRAGRR